MLRKFESNINPSLILRRPRSIEAATLSLSPSPRREGKRSGRDRPRTSENQAILIPVRAKIEYLQFMKGISRLPWIQRRIVGVLSKTALDHSVTKNKLL